MLSGLRNPGSRLLTWMGFCGRGLRRGPSIHGDADRSNEVEELQSSKATSRMWTTTGWIGNFGGREARRSSCGWSD